ncbi:enolase C-terminal domain-like protein, partial [Pseudomonas sp.]|uniref:enolase C-terminal domain-like protein n=1 Tax=Pseudomonas sp. TaxID=306 RepID=UPI002587207B
MRQLTIKRIEAYVCRPDQPGSTWTPEQPNPFTTHTFVRIHTEDGYVGCAATDSYTTYCVDTVLLETLKDLAPELIGKSANDRVALWSHLKPKAYARSAQAQALIDVALWDLAAQAAGKPLYHLLGASRSTIQAYASTPVLASPEAYVDYVGQWVEEGFRALKFHCWCRPTEDLKMIEAVHKAHGDKGLALMLDVEQRYDLAGAMDVGQILSELQYEWFEAPLDDYDLAGYQRLSKHLSVPILAAGNAITD